MHPQFARFLIIKHNYPSTKYFSNPISYNMVGLDSPSYIGKEKVSIAVSYNGFL